MFPFWLAIGHLQSLQTTTLVGIGFSVLAGILLFFLYYVGFFYKVHVSTSRPVIPNVKVAFKFHVGKYSSCGEFFGELERICPEMKSFGIYYDDPEQVNADKCRYIVGVILSEGNSEPDKNDVKKLTQAGFRFADFPKVDFAVQTTHPFVNVLSVIFAVRKCYPKMEQYIKDNGLTAHPFLEIYYNKTIHYMAPLSKHSEFYVDEVKDML